MQLVRETMGMFPDGRTMPIWHMHEPIDYLIHLCAGGCFDYIGIGSSAQYSSPDSPQWKVRIKEAMDAIERWEIEER